MGDLLSSFFVDDGLDAETAILIAELVLEDVEGIEARQKGKGREDDPADADIALTAQANYAREHQTLIRDTVMAQSLERAIHLDCGRLDELEVISRGEADDHRAAIALQGGQTLPLPTAAQRAMEHVVLEEDDGSTLAGDVEQESVTVNDDIDREEHPTYESSSNRPRTTQCIACTSWFASRALYNAPCQHNYCRDCLTDLVATCAGDETLFPLRCCNQQFSLNGVATFVRPHAFSRLYHKLPEYETPHAKRVYCPDSSCSSFVGSAGDDKSDIACANCGNSVCTACKTPSHPHSGCPDNEDTRLVKALALEQHWQICPGCDAIVELDHGCNHMTCRCRTQFCYVCASLWKNCSCPQWDEDRLTTDAHRRVVNQFGQRAAVEQPQQHAARVQARAREIRHNHDCVNHRWTYRPGGGRCEECHYRLDAYLLRCRACDMLACVRCSRNRLP